MWARLRSWMDSLTEHERVEREMAEEIEFHLAARTDDLVRRGLSPQEASRRARLEFGAVDTITRKRVASPAACA